MKLNVGRGNKSVKWMRSPLLTSLVVFVGVMAGQEQDTKFDSHVESPAYPRIHPTMMLDRGHFNLRTAGGQSIDKTFGALFKNDGYDVVRNDGRFSLHAPNDVRVLVIAVAAGGNTSATLSSPAFTHDEVEIISSWIERGGSMFLLFDHYPFAASIETFANRFGVQVELGLASDEAHAVDPKDCRTCKSAWIEYRRDNGLLWPHPITEGRNESERLNRVVTFGGSSLSAADSTDEFLRLANSASNVQYAPSRIRIQSRHRRSISTPMIYSELAWVTDLLRIDN